MRSFAVFILALVISTVGAHACLWDYDTLATEAKGLPEVFDVLTGRFERNPPLYHEMRLARVTELLATDPADLEAYDGAGVACDRLGRSDEAIAWMARKLAQLTLLDSESGAWKEHRYRYLANLGTFHAHRWFKGGADREAMDDLIQARDLLAEAIALNPDAHFGRERYQLRFVEWVIEGPALLIEGEQRGVLPDFLGILVQEGTYEFGLLRADEEKLAHYDDAVAGITGLMVLGAAWESVDATYALSLALEHEGAHSIAHLATLRWEELVDSGHESVVPNAPRGAALKQLLRNLQGFSWVIPEQKRSNAEEFMRQRRNAEEWHAHRTEFMLARLEAGQHPDTHTDFWAGYKPLKELRIKSSLTRHQWYEILRRATPIGVAFVVLLLAFLVFRGVIRGRARRTAN